MTQQEWQYYWQYHGGQPPMALDEAACLWDMVAKEGTAASDWEGLEEVLAANIARAFRLMQADPDILAYWREQHEPAV